ncbi:MAG: efflux RND transporter periplasmic adaptor subunit [Oligoflexales bacterium]|nr:efflux RND transporter periplasmic adaptor subunit [Oligoflexales bacterium]
MDRAGLLLSIRISVLKIVIFVVIVFFWFINGFSIAGESGGKKNPICYTRQELTLKSGGFLQRVFVADGQEVKKNDLIAEMDNRILKTALREAKAGLTAAKANFGLAQDALTRLQKLSKTDTVAPQELFSAEMTLEKARAQVEQAESILERTKIQLDDTRIIADIDGRVRGLPLVKGLYIQAGHSLGSIEAKPSSGCASDR